ncbi:hypothetical protein ScPMuIL_006521 [Solemya velum]
MEKQTLFQFLLLAFRASSASDVGSADIGWFWQVTDFHYDANYSLHGNPSTMCHTSGGDKYNNGIYGNYLCDSPWRLVESAVNEMKSQNGTPDFILWTGDSVPHVKDSELNLAKVFENIRKVSDQLRDEFPNTTIYPVLGNHDPFPSNQMSDAMQYYQGVLNSSHWDYLLDEQQQADFIKGGYYSTVTDYGLRVLGLNTNLYYNMDKVTVMIWDPASQFEWMWNQLVDARQHNQMVYIVSHVAPGAFERMIDMTWFYPEHNERYLSILREFSDIIAVQIYGHDHTDSFRVLYSGPGLPVSSLLLSPAVTPWKSTLPGVGANNPSLRLYKYNRKTGLVLDYIQYFVNLTAANTDNQTDWQVEYQATQEYNITDLSANSLHKLLMSFKNDSSGYFQKYLVYNSVGYDMNPVCNESCVRAQVCAIEKLGMKEYKFCMEGKHHKTTDIPPTTHHPKPHKKVPQYMFYVIGTLAFVVVILFVVIMMLCISRRRHIAPYRRFSTSLNA